MVNTTPWQGIIQSNLRHKRLPQLLSYLVYLLGEAMVFSKEPGQEKLEVQDTEISTSRRVVVKQDTSKPAFISTSSVPGSEPWEFGIHSSVLMWPSPPRAFAPTPPFSSQTIRVLSFVSQHLTRVHSTNASEMTMTMDKWLWQRLCEQESPRLSSLTLSVTICLHCLLPHWFASSYSGMRAVIGSSRSSWFKSCEKN